MSTGLHLPSPTLSWKWSFSEALSHAERRFIVTETVLPRTTHWDFMSLEKGSDEMGRSAIQIKKCIAYLI